MLIHHVIKHRAVIGLIALRRWAVRTTQKQRKQYNSGKFYALMETISINPILTLLYATELSLH